MSCLWCENCHENLIDYDEDTFSEELQLFICEGCSNKFLEGGEEMNQKMFAKAVSSLFLTRDNIKALQGLADIDRELILTDMWDGETRNVGRLQVTCYGSDNRSIDLDELQIYWPTIYNQMVKWSTSRGVKITEQERRKGNPGRRIAMDRRGRRKED